jgi:hypothetical protein
MLYQDALTGALHEAPDGQLYESDFGEYPYQMGEPVFDGLGNPVGFLPFIPKIASLASSLLPKVGNIVGGLFGGGAPPIPPLPQLPGLPSIGAALPAAAGAAIGSLIPRPFRPPWPAGWVTPPLPYTGLGPKRLYMRCAVWPGPRGLVPVSAAQAAALPAQTAAAAAAQTAAAMGMRRRRRRRR